jgi:hypothetical protein
MALPGVPQTFAVENAADMVNKLAWEIEGLRDETEIEKKLWRAFNCSVTAWHVTDWLWCERGEEQSLGAFQTAMIERCPALLACKHIANASKHRGVERKPDHRFTVKVEPTDDDIGEFPQAILDSTRSNHWKLVIGTPDGEFDAFVLFDSVRQFWDETLAGAQRMADVTEAEIEKRAKELATQDGYSWELEFRPVQPGAMVEPQRYLSDERRQQYLDRARAELHTAGT